jgi:hypothetical protein
MYIQIGLKLRSFFARMASEFPLKPQFIDEHVDMTHTGSHYQAVAFKKERQPDDDGKSKRGNSMLRFLNRQ